MTPLPTDVVRLIGSELRAEEPRSPNGKVKLAPPCEVRRSLQKSEMVDRPAQGDVALP
jgi:hypothetical protein